MRCQSSTKMLTFELNFDTSIAFTITKNSDIRDPEFKGFKMTPHLLKSECSFYLSKKRCKTGVKPVFLDLTPKTGF
jgi:hypothetical protein